MRALQSILQEGIDLQKTMKRFPPEAVKARATATTLDKLYMEERLMGHGIQDRERYPELAAAPKGIPLSMSWVRNNNAMPALWCFETIIQLMEEADPTTKKAYVFDLLRIWMGDPDFLIEDIGQVGDELEVIVAARNSGFFRRLTPTQLHERRGQRIAEFIENGENLRYITIARDIGRIADDITYLTKTDPAVIASRAELARQEEQSILRSASAKIVHDTGRFKMVMPLDPVGAMFYGRQTRWCTASKKQNQFGRYMANHFLFIIFDRAKGTKSQIAVPRSIEHILTYLPELKKKARGISRAGELNQTQKSWVQDEYLRTKRHLVRSIEFRDEKDDRIEITDLDPEVVDAIDAIVPNFKDVLYSAIGTPEARANGFRYFEYDGRRVEPQ